MSAYGKYTGDHLYQMVKGNVHLRALHYTDYTIATAVNSLIQHLKTHHGLETKSEIPNHTKGVGKYRHAYNREDLKKALIKYKESTNVHKNQGRFIICETILSAFEFIDNMNKPKDTTQIEEQ